MPIRGDEHESVGLETLARKTLALVGVSSDAKYLDQPNHEQSQPYRNVHGRKASELESETMLKPTATKSERELSLSRNIINPTACCLGSYRQNRFMYLRILAPAHQSEHDII